MPGTGRRSPTSDSGGMPRIAPVAAAASAIRPSAPRRISGETRTRVSSGAIGYEVRSASKGNNVLPPYERRREAESLADNSHGSVPGADFAGSSFFSGAG